MARSEKDFVTTVRESLGPLPIADKQLKAALRTGEDEGHAFYSPLPGFRCDQTYPEYIREHRIEDGVGVVFFPYGEGEEATNIANRFCCGVSGLLGLNCAVAGKDLIRSLHSRSIRMFVNSSTGVLNAGGVLDAISRDWHSVRGRWRSISPQMVVVVAHGVKPGRWMHASEDGTSYLVMSPDTNWFTSLLRLVGVIASLSCHLAPCRLCSCILNPHPTLFTSPSTLTPSQYLRTSIAPPSPLSLPTLTPCPVCLRKLLTLTPKSTPLSFFTRLRSSLTRLLPPPPPPSPPLPGSLLAILKARSWALERAFVISGSSSSLDEDEWDEIAHKETSSTMKLGAARGGGEGGGGGGGGGGGEGGGGGGGGGGGESRERREATLPPFGGGERRWKMEHRAPRSDVREVDVSSRDGRGRTRGSEVVERVERRGTKAPSSSTRIASSITSTRAPSAATKHVIHPTRKPTEAEIAARTREETARRMEDARRKQLSYGKAPWE